MHVIDANDKHSTEVLKQDTQSAVLKRTLDSTVYYVELKWEGKALLKEKEKIILYCFHKKILFRFHVLTVNEPDQLAALPNFSVVESLAKNHWASFWEKGAAVDFSHCTDPRAKELERRVVLSQYLLAIQCAGSTLHKRRG